MKKLLFLFQILCFSISALAYSFTTDGIYYNITYSNTPFKVEVTHNGTEENSYTGAVTIPATVTYQGQNYSVTSIGSYAFDRSTSLTSVIIPNSVTRIGDWAFRGCTSLASITVPNSVTRIGEFAFYYCTSLASITVPNSVTSIGVYCFDGSKWYNDKPDGVVYAGKVLYKYKGTMPSNTNISVLDGTVSIADGAFMGCTGLTFITIPNSVMSIEGGTFENTKWYIDKPDGVVYAGKVLYKYKGIMPNNTNISVLDGTVSITAGAFEGYSGLASISIPSSSNIGIKVISQCINLRKLIGPADLLNTICIGDDGAFRLDLIFEETTHSLDTVIINSGVLNYDGISVLQLSNKKLKHLDLKDTQNKELAIESFYNSFNLDSLQLPTNLEKIKYKEFAECISLKSIKIPANITEIGKRAFENCRSIKNVTFAPNSQLKTIDNWAFYACHGLQSITIPNGVTTVGDGAFWGCEYLSNLTLPSTVQKINDNGFDGCIGLSKIKVEATLPPVVSAKTFNRVNKNASVYVPDASVSMYKNAFGWKDFFNIKGISTQVQELDEPSYGIRIIDRNIEITNANGRKINVYNISGRTLFTKTASLDSENIQLSNKGVYLLAIDGFNRKIIVD